MKYLQYKDFSWNTHQKNWRGNSPNVCQFELTFSCALHCRHCYSDCFNKPEDIARELDTKEVKTAIDKLRALGIFWICFTGGDPLARKDFLEIYAHTKERGMLATIFTNSYSMTEKIADYLCRYPPFVIEVTFNSVTRKTCEAITGVEGAYEKTIAGLNLLLQRKLPFKVKTMATRQNYAQLPRIREFLAAKGIRFRYDAMIFARLNGDQAPCALRLSPEEIFQLDKVLGIRPSRKNKGRIGFSNAGNKKRHKRLFRCALGSGDGINLDPYGRMFACCCIREPSIDFLKSDLAKLKKAIFKTFPQMAQKEFKSGSKCASCQLVGICGICPGKRFLETGDLEAPVEYFCRLAEASKDRWKK